MNIYYFIILLFVLYLLLKKDNIEPFLEHIDIDDFQYVPSNSSNTNKILNNMLNNYYIRLVPEHEKSPGFLSDIYDYMGKDNHHYLFESPPIDDKERVFNKTWDAYIGIENYGRPITYPSQTEKMTFLNNEKNLNSMLINEPHQYRDPEQLGNKIVYDFSNSLDFEHEMRERELRLRGFRRSSLTKKDDYLSMTFCDDIDEMGTDFPCYKFGKEYNYDLDNRLRLAKYRDPETHPNIKKEKIDYINNISANICCKR